MVVKKNKYVDIKEIHNSSKQLEHSLCIVYRMVKLFRAIDKKEPYNLKRAS